MPELKQYLQVLFETLIPELIASSEKKEVYRCGRICSLKDA